MGGWTLGFVVLLAVGCSSRAQPSARPTTAPGAREAGGAIASPDGVRIDGIVVWAGPWTDAPATVRERIELAQLLLDTLASAPRPTIDYQTHGDEWDRWNASTRGHFAAYDERVRAWGARVQQPDRIPGLTELEERLHHTLVRLVEQHALARYLSELRVGRPAFGSCYHSPDEAFGDVLNDTLEAARRCLELSPQVAGPLGANADMCRRHAAWSEALIETGVHGHCEPPEPGR